MRVVSLTCSNTEIVCALGAADCLVGVDDYSDHPAAVVAALPRLGPDLGIDVDRVASLAPDLVLASLTVPGHERVVERIEAAGLPFIAPRTETLEDTYDDIRRIAELLGVAPRGEALVAEMQAALTRPLAPAPPADFAPPAVLVEWWPRPVIVPGRRSWVTDLLEAAGGRNPLADDDVTSRAVSAEEARALAPEAIVISWCGIAPEKLRPEKVHARVGWQGIPAVRNRRVHCVPEAFLGRPGPRLVEGFSSLRAIVEEIQASAARMP